VSLFAVVAALAAFVVIGLVVDGGAKIHAQQHAQAVAREAARTGGQALDAPAAILGARAVVDPYAAKSAAQEYLAASGLPGSVTVAGGTRLVVQTTATYDPVFLSIVGIGTQHVTGHAEARLVRAIGGTEQ
jgi:hypothetical protein